MHLFAFRRVVALALAFTPAAPTAAQDPPAFTTPRCIGPVHVLDVATGQLQPDQLLHIEQGRIVQLLPFAQRPPGVQVVAPPAPFASPALWDMHAVLTRYAPALEHPAQLAFGVVRIRSIVSCPREGTSHLHPCVADVARWNAAVREGRQRGPLVMGSGSYPVRGPAQVHRDAVPASAVATPAQARAFVREFVSQPLPPSHIKSYDGIPRDSFLALLDEARAAGVEVSGHVPTAVPVAEAARAGLRAIAHARVLPIGCSAAEDRIIEQRSHRAPAREWMALALATQDDAVCQRLWATLRDHGSFVSPTLLTRYNETRSGALALAADADTQALTPWLFKHMWSEDLDAFARRGPEEEALYVEYHRIAALRVAQAGQAGVRLLLGTDTFDTHIAPGVALHQEMALWQAAGVPALGILRAGTVNAAAYFGLQDTHGQLMPGYSADIVFTEHNPLADLRTLRRPAGVMQEGRLHDAAALHAAAQQARDAARGAGFTLRLLWDWLRNPMGFMP